jgi:hypothetical protein
MKIKNLIILLLTSAFIASCATQTFNVNPNVKREVPARNPHFSQWSNFFVGGIGQTDFKNAAEMCKDNGGVAFVETRQSFGQVLVNAFTWGIYSPRTINIYCNKE